MELGLQYSGCYSDQGGNSEVPESHSGVLVDPIKFRISPSSVVNHSKPYSRSCELRYVVSCISFYVPYESVSRGRN